MNRHARATRSQCLKPAGGFLTARRFLTILVLALAGAPAQTLAQPEKAPADLRILRVSPSGNEVEPGRQIVIQFDRDMVALGDMRHEADDPDLRVRPDPGCEWRWLNTRELACRLPAHTQLAPATEYTVTVGTGLRARDGHRLAEPVTHPFATVRPRVDNTAFVRWNGPTEPVLRIELNVPVTADALSQALTFTTASADVPARVLPFSRDGDTPEPVPAPEHPGAVLMPQGTQPPADASAADRARRVWQVRPRAPLPEQADTRYAVTLSADLTTPLGTLRSRARSLYQGRVFGALALEALECGTRDNDGVRIEPVRPSADADPATPPATYSALYADSLAKLATQRCRPESARLHFNTPVPRKTLEAIEWRAHEHERETSAAPHAPWARDDTPDHVGAYEAEAGSRYALPFDLIPRERYELVIPAGVKDVFGRSLAQTVTLPFLTAHRAPFLQVPPSEGVLETDQPTLVPFRFTNLDQLTLTYHRLTAAELASGTWTRRQRVDLLADVDLRASEDQLIGSNLRVRDLLGGKTGLLLGELSWAPGMPGAPYALAAQVTPWNVLAKEGHYGTLVWVARLDDGKPVADADVQVYTSTDLHTHPPQAARDAQGEPIHARTDAQGLAHLPRFWPHDDETGYIAVVRDGEMAWLPLDWSFSRSIYEASHGRVWQDHEARGQRQRFWAVTSQGIYPPGSQVQYAAFVRTEGNARLEPADPRGRDIVVTLTDPEGNSLIEQEKHTLSSYGDFHGEVSIPTTAPMGWYDIQIGWVEDGEPYLRHAGRFLVTDFVPASFQVRTQILAERLGPGDEVLARATARLHAGGPYTNAATTFTTRLVAQRFSPDTPVAAGFAFGDDQALPSPQTLARDATWLDDQGHAENRLTLPDTLDVLYGELRVEAAAASGRGQSVANSTAVPFASRDRFIGLRTDQWVQRAGEPFQAAYVVTDEAGQPQADQPVTLTLEFQDVSRVRQRDADGDYIAQDDVRWIEEDRCEARSAVTAATCTLTPSQPGRYRVTGSVDDTQGRTQRSTLGIYVAGSGHTLWSQDRTVLSLVPDAAEYQVGDTARVLVQNPYPGARALLTVERYGVLWQRVVTLADSAPILEIPIEDTTFPGAFLSVTVFSPRASPVADPDLGKPIIAQGYLPLRITGPGSALDVKVQADVTETRPGEPIAVQVQVADRDGQAPGPTRLVAVAVDEAVLDLLREGRDYYDPRKTFYAPPEGPDVRNYSLVERLLSQLEAKDGKGRSPSAGGGSAGPRLREHFSYLAFWDATLETDAEGHARFTFEAPDNLTRWRIFVIAMTPGEAMGLGDTGVRVNLPLQVQPALPNLVRVGDQFSAGFEIINRTPAPLADIRAELAASGSLADNVATDQATLTLDSFARGQVWLPLTASETGAIELSATVQAGDLSDGVRHTIPVDLAGSAVSAATLGSLTQGSVEIPVQVPEEALPDTARAHVTLSPTLVAGLQPALERMRDDTRRDWEARLSRAVLAATALQLQDVLGEATWPAAQRTIDDTLKAASEFQAGNGGMAFWVPRDAFVSPYLSVYTALALAWLDEAGHPVPVAFSNRLRAYLRDKVLNADNGDDGDALLRVGAMAALAQWPEERIDPGEIANRVPEQTTLPLFGQALLLNAALAVDDAHSAAHIVATVLSRAEESAGETSFNESRQAGDVRWLETPLRSNCALLDALSRYQARYPDDPQLGEVPQKLMRWVTARRALDGSWPNSQENVFCTHAIARYTQVHEAPVTSLTGTMQWPDRPARHASFTSRAQAPARLTEAGLTPGRHATVTLDHAGAGRLYYNLQLDYIMPAGALPAANAGMTVKRHYHVLRGAQWQPVDDTTVLQRGDIVRVDLDVDTPTERHQVVLADPLPGAFEAVNRALDTAAQTLPDDETDERILLRFEGGPWPDLDITEGGFYHREVASDAVRFHADRLPAGHYRLVYSVQVVAPGTFTAPAPLVQAIYQPDLFGRGRAQHLQVKRPAP